MFKWLFKRFLVVSSRFLKFLTWTLELELFKTGLHQCEPHTFAFPDPKTSNRLNLRVTCEENNASTHHCRNRVELELCFQITRALVVVCCHFVARSSCWRLRHLPLPLFDWSSDLRGEITETARGEEDTRETRDGGESVGIWSIVAGFKKLIFFYKKQHTWTFT